MIKIKSFYYLYGFVGTQFHNFEPTLRPCKLSKNPYQLAKWSMRLFVKKVLPYTIILYNITISVSILYLYTAICTDKQCNRYI